MTGFDFAKGSPPKAEIIAIGNELLLGIVQDTNTHWLCKQITGLGGRIHRCQVIPDNLAAIREAVLLGLSSEPELLLIMGGLGPTQDDMTLAGIASALEIELYQNEEALKMITQRYQDLVTSKKLEVAEMNESRAKMSLLPQDSKPLSNGVGTAPAVFLKHNRTSLVALPGVPEEMKVIFGGSLRPLLNEIFGERFFIETTLVIDLNDESLIAPLLKELQSKHGEAYIKSRPKGFEDAHQIWITVAMSGDRKNVNEYVSRLLEELKRELSSKSIEVLEIKDS